MWKWIKLSHCEAISTWPCPPNSLDLSSWIHNVTQTRLSWQTEMQLVNTGSGGKCGSDTAGGRSADTEQEDHLRTKLDSSLSDVVYDVCHSCLAVWCQVLRLWSRRVMEFLCAWLSPCHGWSCGADLVSLVELQSDAIVHVSPWSATAVKSGVHSMESNAFCWYSCQLLSWSAEQSSLHVRLNMNGCGIFHMDVVCGDTPIWLSAAHVADTTSRSQHRGDLL